MDFVGLPWKEITGWTAFTVLAFAVLFAFIKGIVQPRSNVDLWKTAWEKAMDAAQKRDEAVDEMTQVGRTTLRILEEIQRRGYAEDVTEIHRQKPNDTPDESGG